MKPRYTFLLLALSACLLTGCHGYEEYEADAYGTFDCIWQTIDNHYCFFEEKNVDWDEVRTRYRARIIPGITQQELFDLCSEMLAELKDGHVNLAWPFDVSYYRAWWTDYPQDFNLRTVQQYYLNFDYNTTTGLIYKTLPENIGYLYYPSFDREVGEGNLDYVLSMLSTCNALIIDIRDNSGGELTNIRTFLSRFIHETTIGGYMRHKTGPGHSDFSDPYPVEYKPAKDGHVVWDKPIAVLTNRSCFSAANDFVAVMKELGNVKIIGARTGGGGGMPFTYSTPLGWTMRFSTCPMADVRGRSIEDGIYPSPGCEVHAPDEELALGKDAILDFAIALFAGQ